MKKTLLFFSLLALSGCANHGSSQSKEKSVITVSAAASLKEALSDIEVTYEKAHPDIDIKFNYGASGSLSNQIKAGAPVDLFFSAAQNKVDDLVEAGTVKSDDQKTVLHNQLVAVSKNKLNGLSDLNNKAINKIAIGTPQAVPAGAYAKEALSKAQLWSPIKTKLVYTKDVRQALTYVQSENADVGIVYMTDAKNTELKQLPIDDELHQPITYPLALIKDSSINKAFYQYLQSDAAKKVYQSYGFITE
ncbi:putative ABC transporter substrate-binding lipoprotein YvgL [Macrococcus hajekii]|nr:molybdate ABC transporter substrate-binding protein [Macrococcus hajekii]GGB08513.1 putative ABC transporter substrate-binding lipoprotein YvgL [Macrococcus hajekii]